MIQMIAAVTQQWGIGKNNTLPFHLQGDLRHFKTLTQGSIVVMGRKTFESLPNGALKNRRNIILTRTLNYHADHAEILHDIDDVLKLHDIQPIWIIGGGELYRQFLPFADACHITTVHASPECDAFFPDLRREKGWYQTHQSDPICENGLSYTFDIWRYLPDTPLPKT